MMAPALPHSSGFRLPYPEMQPPREESVLAPAPGISLSEELRNSNLVRSQRKLLAWQEQLLLILNVSLEWLVERVYGEGW